MSHTKHEAIIVTTYSEHYMSAFESEVARIGTQLLGPVDSPVNGWLTAVVAMTRQDCLRWLREHGYPEPPKSACIGCPYHDNAFWRSLRDNTPSEWADAVAFDLDIRTFLHRDRNSRQAFLHRDRVPLGDVDLSTAEERGQQVFSFQDECEGMCGT